MDRDEAIKLLTGGPEGVAEWNRWRELVEVLPDLTEANFSGANLKGANLARTKLDFAKLSFVDLSNANLVLARFGSAI